jgi:hypothetical protein
MYRIKRRLLAPNSHFVLEHRNLQLPLPDESMIASSRGIQSKRVQGILWLIAAIPMIAVPIVNDGNMLLLVIGLIFLIFGTVALRRSE